MDSRKRAWFLALAFLLLHGTGLETVVIGVYAGWPWLAALGVLAAAAGFGGWVFWYPYAGGQICLIVGTRHYHRPRQWVVFCTRTRGLEVRPPHRFLDSGKDK